MNMRKTIAFLVGVSLLLSLVGAVNGSAAWSEGLFGKLKPGHKGTKRVEQKKTAAGAAKAPEAVEPYDPIKYPAPDKDYMVKNCEPIRNEIVTLNRKFFLIRPAYQGKVILLKRKHEACMAVFNQQEIKFIKNYQFSQKALEKAKPIEGESVLRLPPPAP